MNKYSPEYMVGNRRTEKNLGIEAIEKAFESKQILEARVSKCNSNNDLTLALGNGITGIIPFSEIEYHPNGSPIKAASATSKINKHVKFIITNIKENEDKTFTVECSRKLVQQDCYENFISKLTPGDIIDAYALKIVGYGIFCDIGCGIVALLPTNNISVTHTVNPVRELKGISQLKAIVKSIDENYKVELTHKELLGTWSEEVSKFNVDDIVSGTVLSVEDYGVFVRIDQNLSGLADVTNIELSPDDLVSVRIQSIQDKNMKIKLSVLEKIGEVEDTPVKFDYNITEPHVTDWVYSTPTAKKQIESHF